MSHHVRKELQRLRELEQHNPNTTPIKRQIEVLEARLDLGKSKKKAKTQAKKAASGLTGREERLQKVVTAEQAAAQKLADATEQAKTSLQDYTQLQENDASESELAELWGKVLDYQEKERIATTEFKEAEQKTLRTTEALQRSLANALSASSNFSPTAAPSGSLPPSGFPPPSGPLISANTTSLDEELMQDENDGEDVIIPDILAEDMSSSKDKGKARAEEDTPQFLVDDEEEEEEVEEEEEETVSKGAKRPTKIFKRTDEEKEAWVALTANYSAMLLMQFARSNAIPCSRADGKRPALIDLLFKSLETLPTGLELDEFREAVRTPMKDKRLEENWGNKEFAKL